jgi:hypothetical protein
MTASAEIALLDEIDSTTARLQHLHAMLRDIKAPGPAAAEDGANVLAALGTVRLPPYEKATAVEWQDVRTAYVLQSFINAGRRLGQQEAAEIVRRAGYSDGSGANALYRHGWLASDDDGTGRSTNRRVTDHGLAWLERIGRRALLAYLRG